MLGWEELTERYISELRGRQRSLALCKNEKKALDGFQAYCLSQGLLYPNSVKLAHLHHFSRRQDEKGIAETTRYAKINSIRRCFKWAVHRGHLLDNPFAAWVSRHPPFTLRIVPTEAQMLALVEAPPADTLEGQRDRALLEFLYGTGVRIQECADGCLDDLDLGQAVFTVRSGKGDHSRNIPLGPRLAEIMAKYLRDIRPKLIQPRPTVRNPKPKLKVKPKGIFVDNKGKTMRDHLVLGRVNQYSQKACGIRFSPHSIRHAYATHLLLGGAPVVLVQRLLGHKTLQSTAIYTRILPLDVNDEMKRTHPRCLKKKPRS